jgi:hypothetical protein
MGLIQNLVDRYKKHQEQLAEKQKFQQEQKAIERAREAEQKAFASKLLAYAEDGKITAEEIEDIERQQATLSISEVEMNEIRIKAYKSAYDAIKRDGTITSEEEEELSKIQKYFKIPDQDIEPTKKELARFRLLREIATGNIPEVTVTNMVVQKGEKAYWAEVGKILEERVIRRRYEGGSHGVSIRIAKGLSYRVGAHRGQLIADSAVVPVSYGELVITNKRIVFKGDKKSFSLKLEKILNIEFYSDGVNMSEESGKHRVVQFNESRNMDIIGSIISYAINNRT